MRLSLPINIKFPVTFFPKRTVAVLLIWGIVVSSVTVNVAAQETSGDSTCPNEEPVTVPMPENEYRPISMGSGSRPGHCITPDMIFMHATEGGSLESNWSLFNSGGLGGNGTNAHFIIGKDGQILQTVPLYQSMVEFAATNTPMNDRSIGIELVHPRIDFEGGKSGMPIEQYNSALKLVCFLMGQYSIPLGANEAEWVSERNFWAEDPAWAPGVYGHYQIGRPPVHQDPGKQWLADFREDLRAGKCSTVPSTGGGGGGRIVPYDAYARPYSWPITGKIKQPYGFTEEAQNLGKRFPGYYPYGNPNAIFSVTNHDEPPIDPATAKYINPNIDIEPSGDTASARAVYATQAGWLTFADWAGPEKGYTIQIESDVEGDGQSDLATRYMRLEPPKDGFFAPNIPITHPVTGGTTGMNGACTDPPDEDWANVNRWNEQIKTGIAEIMAENGVEVPCNLVKAFMKLESGGEELPPNVDGYMGLMQVGTSSATGGGSNCNWQKYDVTTTQGNINCGVQEIANGYEDCDQSWDGAILKYFSGQCVSTGATDAFGTSTDQYLQIVKENWEYLDSLAGSDPQVTPTLPQPNPTAQNPEPLEQQAPPPYVLEAEHMEIDEGAPAQVVHDDSAASAGASVAFSGSTFIQKDVAKKADQLMIRAKAALNFACFTGESAQMEVYIDNQLVDTIEVASNIWQTHPLPVEGLDGSEHNLSIRLANPGALLCDRILWVDAIHYIITNPNTPTIETVSSVVIEAEDLPDATETDKPTNIHDDEMASGGQYVAFTSNSKIEGEVEFPESNYFSIRARADLCGEEVPIIRFSLDGTEIISLGVDQTYWTEYEYKLQPGQSVTTPVGRTPTTGDPNTTPVEDNTDTPADDDGGDTGSDNPPPPPPGQPGPLVQGESIERGDVLQATDEEEPAEEENSDLHTITIEFINDEFQSPTCDRNVYVDVITIKKFDVTQATYSKTSLIGQTTYVAFNQLIGYVSGSRSSDVEWEAFNQTTGTDLDETSTPEDVEAAKQAFYSRIPNANQTYLSYRIMYNNPNFTTFPPPTERDLFINAKVDDPYIVETDDNKVAGSLKTVYDEPQSPMFFFCALRQRGDNVRCIFEANPY